MDPLKQIGQLANKLPIRYWGHRLLDLPVLFKWVKIPQTASVLEIGFGSGQLTRYLSSKIKYKNYTAIDINPKLVAQADLTADNKSKVIYQVADACKLPFEKASFDFVFIFDLLHHLPDWKKAIREIHRVLRKNGKLLIRDYSVETFTFPGIGMLFQKIVDHPYDMMFDQVELLTYIRKNGFIITHQNDNTWMILLAAVKNENRSNH